MSPARRLVVLALLVLVAPPGPAIAQTTSDVPVFRSQINLVSLAAVVRDRRGRVVPSLKPTEVEVLENGRRVPLLDVRSEADAPANIALLVDGSGSMGVQGQFAIARAVSEQILQSLQPGRDEAALYSFDTRVLTLQPFTPELAKVRHALSYLDTWGSTSLYDAISGVAGKIHERGESRRAIVLFTDGADTGSSLTPADASSIASALDVPIYVFALNPSSPRPVDGKAPEPALAQVARATGGLYFSATDAPTLQSQVNTLIDELHHQQVLAFEASTEPGWRSLELRVRKRGYKIRSRGWYWAGETPAPATLPESR